MIYRFREMRDTHAIGPAGLRAAMVDGMARLVAGRCTERA